MTCLAAVIQDSWSARSVGLAISMALGIALGAIIATAAWRSYFLSPRAHRSPLAPKPTATSEAYRLLLERILATTPALIVVLDHQGRFIKFNQACVTLTGFQPAEVLGQPFWDTVIPPEERDQLRVNYTRLITTLTPRPYESDWIDTQGRRHTILWSNAVVKGATDADTIVIATGIDTTESRRLQSELIHAQRMEAIGQLASGISHDINNLLTAIFGHIALAKRLLPTAHAASASLDRVEQAAEQAGRVIRSLLTFSTNTRSEKIPTPVAPLLAEAATLIEGLLPANIRLITIPPAADLWIKADRSLIVQALINLAINARDAMPAGGTLTLSAHADEASLFLTLEDTGVGIPKELLPRVLEPFFSTKSRANGAALGLTVARSIISDHAGTLDIHSEPGLGTRLTLTIPTRPAPPIAPLITPDSPGLIVASARAYPRQIMASTLGTLGVPVRSVGDAAALLRELRDGPKASVLVADISLTAGLGEVLKLAAQRSTRVVIVGNPSQCSTARSFDAYFLPEPFSTAQLLEAVRTLTVAPSASAAPEPISARSPA